MTCTQGGLFPTTTLKLMHLGTQANRGDVVGAAAGIRGSPRADTLPTTGARDPGLSASTRTMLTLSLYNLGQQNSTCGPKFSGTNGDRPSLMTLPFMGMGKWVACPHDSDACTALSHPSPRPAGRPVSLRGIWVRQRNAHGRTPLLLVSACRSPSSSLSCIHSACRISAGRITSTKSTPAARTGRRPARSNRAAWSSTRACRAIPPAIPSP